VGQEEQLEERSNCQVVRLSVRFLYFITPS
jgi:fermentation-respiration switch protein FrsA (DUF1100 family)